MSNTCVDCKVVLLGQEYGGKTSLLERLLHDRFNDAPYHNTIGAAFGAKRFRAKNNKQVTLGIWDTAGSERYQAMTRIYYRDAKAAIVCYDIAEKKSFEKARFWINELREAEENCKVYLCGTKIDLVQDGFKRRAVDFHDVDDFAEEIGAVAEETSSKTGENVQKLFQKIVDYFASDPNNSKKLQDVIKASPNVDLNQHQYDSTSIDRKKCCKS